MNLTGQPPYSKGKPHKSERRARPPNAAEKRHRARVALLPCVVGPKGCKGRLTIHHTGTGGGGRKNHMKILPLCHEHHQGKEGVDGKRISKREWQKKYGMELLLLIRVDVALLNLAVNGNGEA